MHRGGAPDPGGLALVLEELQVGFKTPPSGCANLATPAAAGSAFQAVDFCLTCVTRGDTHAQVCH